MEAFVLKHLSWKVNMVTPIVMITFMLSQFQLSESTLSYIYSLAHHCAENLQAEHTFMCYYASEIAMTSIYWAFQMSKLPESLFFCGLYSIKDLLCIERFSCAEECHRFMVGDVSSQQENLSSVLFCRPEVEIISSS